jgi:menaquinone-dependent protoporphyrinogen oxidase
MRVLIVYGTGRGQTAKIANFIGRTLRDAGDQARVLDGRSLPTDLVVEHYDAVMIGASLNEGRFQSHIAEFIAAHKEQFLRVPSAFFSVSMAEADPDPQARARVRQSIQQLLEETGWQPDRVASFAGSIAYLRRRWAMRLTYRRIRLPSLSDAERHVDPTSVPGYEYTDWDAVAQFATEFAAMARAARPAAVAA